MLLFDFDGVLINSLDEVTLTAYNAVTGGLVSSPGALPPELVGLFQCNRFHVQPIGDAIPLMAWCLDHYKTAPQRILRPEAYQRILQRTGTPLLERTRRFFDVRQALVVKDPEHWLGLHTPFQPLWRELVRRTGACLVFLTNKNQAAVLRLCRHFGLPVAADQVYAGDNGTNKVENLHRIQKRFKYDHYYFIDDSLKNLQELDAHFNPCRKLLTPLLASWGYRGPDDVAAARAEGYGVLTQSELIAMLDENPDQLSS